MPSALAGQLEELLAAEPAGVVRVPALVKGELRFPPRITLDSQPSGNGSNGEMRWLELDGAYVIQQPTWSNPGAVSSLALPRVDPAELLETDAGLLARTLYNLPFGEICSYVTALRTTLT